MKKIKGKLEESNASSDEVTQFEKGAQALAKKIIGSYKDWEFYVGESMDPEGMVALLNYREDGITPYIVFWKHGLKGGESLNQYGFLRFLFSRCFLRISTSRGFRLI